MAETTTIISDKEKAELSEIMAELAKSFAVGVTDANNATVATVAKNNRGKKLMCYATFNWKGDFKTTPRYINVGQTVQFVHVGPASKGAVIYGEDRLGPNPTAYLLAWSMLEGAPRVYVKCGYLFDIYNDWEAPALAGLDSSSSNSSASDERTSSRAFAQISDNNGSNTTVVGATFA